MEREEGREGRKEDGQKGEGDSSCLVPVKSSSLPARHRENIECRRPLRASFNGSRERFQESRDIASKRIWRGKDERRRRLLAQRKSLKLVVKRSEDGSKVVGRKKKKNEKRNLEPSFDVISLLTISFLSLNRFRRDTFFRMAESFIPSLRSCDSIVNEGCFVDVG